MTKEQTAGNLAGINLTFEQFKDKLLAMRNDEILAIALYMPAAWYGWPHYKEINKAKFLKLNLSVSLPIADEHYPAFGNGKI